MPTIEERLRIVWESRAVKVDWLGMEQIIRDILKSDALPEKKLAQIDETIAAYTRRGGELEGIWGDKSFP